MSSTDQQVPWTDEQWARVRQVISEEANRARVAEKFLPLVGPLPPDTDFVAKDEIKYEAPKPGEKKRIKIEDQDSIKLATLQVKVFLRGAQVADPAMVSALQLFRRAANVLARLEDAMIFLGQTAKDAGPPTASVKGLHDVWNVLGGQDSKGGLFQKAAETVKVAAATATSGPGEQLVTAVSQSIGKLEGKGQFGPFAVVLGQKYFTDVQSPSPSLVLPQDRIIPFLEGGPLLRSSTLGNSSGVVVALGGAPVELIVATDVSLSFLQVTVDPLYVFRVYEKIVLRVKEETAIIALK